MNKKLFKGALVLFASILMAVSCQSNSNPDNDPNKQPGPDNPSGTQKTEITKAKLIESVNSISYTFTASSKNIVWAFTDVMKSNTELGATLKVEGNTTEAATPTGALEALKTEAASNKFVEEVIAKLNAAGFNLGTSDITIEPGNAASSRDANATAIKFKIKVSGLKKVKTTHKLSEDLSTYLGNTDDKDAIILELAPKNGQNWA